MGSSSSAKNLRASAQLLALARALKPVNRGIDEIIDQLRQGQAVQAPVESKLSHAHIIDVSKINADGRVVFGSTVVLHDHESDAEITYQIVGEDEANLREGRVSLTSPIARALIGRSEGDEVSVRTPAGQRDYEILEVRYE